MGYFSSKMKKLLPYGDKKKERGVERKGTSTS